jgi:hypothetical protein
MLPVCTVDRNVHRMCETPESLGELRIVLTFVRSVSSTKLVNRSKNPYVIFVSLRFFYGVQYIYKGVVHVFCVLQA